MYKSNQTSITTFFDASVGTAKVTHIHANTYYPRLRGRRVQFFVCVCVLPQNCCLSSIISKSKQAASHKFGNLRQTVVLYKIGKFLQASVAQIA